MDRCTVEYHYGSYSGTRTVYVQDEDDNEVVINTMWRELRPHMSLGMASQSAKIISRVHVEEDDQ